MAVKRVLLILALSLLGGCSGEPESETVVFWAMGREGELVQSFIPDFQRMNPGIRVQVQQIPWSAAHEKLLTAYAGDALPDVMQLGATWVPEFVALRAIAPLDDRLEPQVMADVFPGLQDASRLEGQLYGAPWYVDTRLLFYRKDILARSGVSEPPATWAAWRQAMVSIRDSVGAGSYPLLLPMNEWQVPVILGLQAGADLLQDDDRHGHFRSPEFRRAFRFYLDLFRQGWAPSLAEAQISNPYHEFAQGRFAFFITGPWNIAEFTRRLPPDVQPLWDTAMMPGPEAGPGVSLAGGALLALSRRSKHPAAAWQWIRFLLEPERQAAFYRLAGDLPARRSAWDRPELVGAAHTAAFRRQLDQARGVPGVPEWERIAARIVHYAERAVRGELSEEQALTALDEDVERILEKRRWLLDRQSGTGKASATP